MNSAMFQEKLLIFINRSKKKWLKNKLAKRTKTKEKEKKERARRMKCKSF